MIFIDQIKRTLNLKDTPKRIVSLVPSQTELLVDLGLESSIVGVTKFCVHPFYLKNDKVVVGGTKQVSFDKIKALQPDIILCNKEENTEEIVLELETLAPVHVSDIYTIEDCIELIELYGKLFSVEENAKGIIKEIRSRFLSFQNFINNKPKLNVAYFIWKTPWMVAANNTFIDYMLNANNLQNVFVDLERYPEIDLHNKHLQQADIVMLSSEPYPFKSKHINALKEILPKSKVILVDGELFSWYGSRLIKAFDYFKTLRQNNYA